MLEGRNTVMPARPKVQSNMGKCPTLVMAVMWEEPESNRLPGFPGKNPRNFCEIDFTKTNCQYKIDLF